MIFSAIRAFFMEEKIQLTMPKEKYICYSCKGITEFEKGKRGSAVIEFLLWTLFFFPGIFYSFWRKGLPKKVCQYCGDDFLMSLGTPEGLDLYQKTIKKNDKNL